MHARLLWKLAKHLTRQRKVSDYVQYGANWCLHHMGESHSPAEILLSPAEKASFCVMIVGASCNQTLLDEGLLY
jgi:hypothetical protein